MVDYPDYLQNVNRAPIQSLPYQTFFCVSAIDTAIAGKASGSFLYEIPNDGKSYVFDTVFMTWTMKGLAYNELIVYSDYPAATFSGFYSGAQEAGVVYSISLQGAFVLKYPGAVFIRIFNSNDLARVWTVYVNGYKY